MAKLEDEVRDLYQGPLGDFTATRQALARRLAKTGDARAADEVKALRKPSLSAWGVNRLFAEEAREMKGLVAAGENARAAQRRVTGGGEAAALRQAIAAARARVEQLSERGAALLAEGSRPPSAAVLERLRANLEALAFNPASAPIAARGWLDEDLEPAGFEVLAGLQLAAAGDRRPGPGGAHRAGAAATRRSAPGPAHATRAEKPGAKPASVSSFAVGAEAARRREAERRQRVEEAKAAVARAEREAPARQRDTERAERAARDAEQSAAEAERRAADQTRRAAELRDRATASLRAAEEARARAAQAEQALARAREELAAADRPPPARHRR